MMSREPKAVCGIFGICWHGIVQLGLFVHFLFCKYRWVGGTGRYYGQRHGFRLNCTYVWHGMVGICIYYPDVADCVGLDRSSGCLIDGKWLLCFAGLFVVEGDR